MNHPAIEPLTSDTDPNDADWTIDATRRAFGMDAQPPMPLALDVPQAAALLGISTWSAYRAIREGSLPSIRLGGRAVRVPVPALMRMLGENPPAN